MSIEVRPTAGLPFSRCSVGEATNHIIAVQSAKGGGLPVHVVAAHGVAVAEGNPDFREAISSGGLVVPDSRWLQLLTAWTRRPLTQVRGADLMRSVLAATEGSDLSHLFLSPNNDVSRALEEAVGVLFPGANVAGFSVFPHKRPDSDELTELVELVSSKGQPIVWIGNGTPAQNYLSTLLAREANCVAIGVGAAFDFIAGIRPEAPRWISRLGVEWLYRLLSEPRRLLKRYTHGNVVFLRAMIKYRGGRLATSV